MRDLLVDLLSGYRLTRVILDDSRDFPPLAPARARLAKTLDRHPPWGDVLGCEWCSSFWVGLGVAAARRLAPRAWGPLADALAVSAVAGLLTGVEKKIEP